MSKRVGIRMTFLNKMADRVYSRLAHLLTALSFVYMPD